MAFRPEIENLHLQPCCIRTLQTIDRRAKMGELLGPAIVIGSFLTVWQEPTKVRNHIIMIKSVKDTDWEVMAKAAIAVPQITRRMIYQDAALEIMKHSSENDLNRFWRSIADHFR